MIQKIFLLSLLFNSFLISQNFKFIAMSDSRGINNGVNDTVLSTFVQHILKNQTDAKFLVFAGDLVDGSRDNPDNNYKELLHWKEVMKPIYENPNMVWPKIWPVIGNHEVQHPEDEDNFRKAFPNVFRNGPDDEKGLSYSFDYQNTHFVFVTTDRWFYGDPNDSTDDRRDWHYIKHIDWLENDLRSANERGVEHIFVVSHEMIYPTGGHLRDGLPNLGRNFKLPMDSTQTWYVDRRQKVIELLEKYNVDAHICGHEHLYARQKVNGVYEIIAGSSGAPLYNFNPVFSKDANTHFPGKEMSYSAAVPYYQALDYNYGPEKNSQASASFVGKRAFNYVVFDVKKDTVFIETYGAFTNKNYGSVMDTEIKLIDRFEIVK
ncbi:MAG: metallophosphoesterase [Melioribacteraceae bacterium]